MVHPCLCLYSIVTHVLYSRSSLCTVENTLRPCRSAFVIHVTSEASAARRSAPTNTCIFTCHPLSPLLRPLPRPLMFIPVCFASLVVIAGVAMRQSAIVVSRRRFNDRSKCPSVVVYGRNVLDAFLRRASLLSSVFPPGDMWRADPNLSVSSSVVTTSET